MEKSILDWKDPAARDLRERLCGFRKVTSTFIAFDHSAVVRSFIKFLHQMQNFSHYYRQLLEREQFK